MEPLTIALVSSTLLTAFAAITTIVKTFFKRNAESEFVRELMKTQAQIADLMAKRNALAHTQHDADRILSLNDLDDARLRVELIARRKELLQRALGQLDADKRKTLEEALFQPSEQGRELYAEKLFTRATQQATGE